MVVSRPPQNPYTWKSLFLPLLPPLSPSFSHSHVIMTMGVPQRPLTLFGTHRQLFTIVRVSPPTKSLLSSSSVLQITSTRDSSFRSSLDPFDHKTYEISERKDNKVFGDFFYRMIGTCCCDYSTPSLPVTAWA